VITHNIALVAELSDRVVVMYAGHVMEIADVEPIFDNPLHPYTKGLLQSIPNIQLDDTEELYKMPGEPPNLTHPPTGCRFHPRCPYMMPVCVDHEPPLAEVNPGRHVKCWLYIDHPEKESETIKVEA
jgi:oligopeptide/dipeptide ABC transporter ATP-binding protein